MVSDSRAEALSLKGGLLVSWQATRYAAAMRQTASRAESATTGRMACRGGEERWYWSVTQVGKAMISRMVGCGIRRRESPPLPPLRFGLVLPMGKRSA